MGGGDQGLAVKHVPEAAMAGMEGWRGESWLAERVVAEVAGISSSVS